MCKEIVDDDEEEEMEAFASIGEEDGEYITTLLDREIANGGLLQVQGFQPKSWIQEARLDGIDYILKVCSQPISFVFMFLMEGRESSNLGVLFIYFLYFLWVAENGTSWVWISNCLHISGLS